MHVKNIFYFYLKLDLEKMQKLQYKHEKEMLRQQSILHNKKTSPKVDKNQIGNASNSSQNEHKDPDELSFSDQELLFENEKEEEDSVRLKSNLGSNTQRSQLGEGQTSRSNLANGTTSVMSNQNKKIDSFNKNMEERAKLREQMRKEREEKRKKAEMDKLEQLRAQQEEKLKVEEEERRKRMMNSK